VSANNPRLPARPLACRRIKGETKLGTADDASEICDRCAFSFDAARIDKRARDYLAENFADRLFLLMLQHASRRRRTKDKPFCFTFDLPCTRARN
jgi:hypothetical protein